MNNQNFGATHKNASCGDSVTVNGTMVDGIITHINFEVHGCSLSQKAATVLAEHVRTMTHQQALAISDHDIQTWLNLTLGPVRLQCALAPVQALKKALEGAK